ncbi:MAG: hypothetical protein AAFU38_11150 [Bacteroidota bacterium]
MSKLFRLGLLLLPLVFLAACDSGGEDDPRVGVTGRWVGELTNLQDMSQVFPIEINVVDTRNNVTGTGVVQLPTEELSFDIIEGLFQTPFLSLTLRFDRAPFQGSLVGNTNSAVTEINGDFAGSGLANGPVMLTLNRAN